MGGRLAAIAMRLPRGFVLMTSSGHTIRCLFFFSSRRRHTRLQGDWSSDVCSSDLLLHEYDRLFLYLNCPGLEATNWRGEQAIRPAVVARKVWGGNRTENGAHGQEEIGRASCRERV